MPIFAESVRDPESLERYHDHPRSVPFEFFVTLRARSRCRANHCQSPERLAERGGLSVREAACILLDLPWKDRPSMEDSVELLKRTS